jgi:hypothetical protein
LVKEQDFLFGEGEVTRRGMKSLLNTLYLKGVARRVGRKPLSNLFPLSSQKYYGFHDKTGWSGDKGVRLLSNTGI